jgi:serine/threonine protein kinase/formylglycine-generating enzyme required for sulfatase activity
MKPTPDDPSEIEPPMTRALFATEADESAQGRAVDPDGTIDGDTKHLSADSDADLSRAAASSLAKGSMSAWMEGTGGSTGLGRRGIVGKIEPGQVLYSKYLVLRKLGSGAMGEVWLVRHVTLKSEHALKVIIPNIASNPVALMRFQRELEIMATLRQEHAVMIYDATIDEDGGYIDMEFLDGQTIHEILHAAKARPGLDPSVPLMPLDWVVRVLDQLCEVLHVAHEKGIVHRDLKPSNMMLLNGRKPGKEYLKVLDFGIAKIRDDPESGAGRGQEEEANKTLGFIGTPSYASPEQAMAFEDLDGRADLYSVGIMLYEFVTGRLPFRGNHWQVMSQNATAPPPPFSEANPRLRPMPELEHAILRVLSKDRNQRPQTALELFDEIRQAVEVVLPGGSTGGLPPTWDSLPGLAPPSPSHSTLFPTERDSKFVSGPVSTQDATLVGEAAHPQPVKSPSESPSELGPIVTEETGIRRSRVVLLVAFLLASVLAIGLVVLSSRKFVTPEPPPKPPIVKKGGPDPTLAGKALPFERYWPASYIAVKGPDEESTWPARVRRTTDEVIFYRLADGIYLPEGYKAEDPADLAEDGWPKAIIREGVRFLRIAGKEEWVMGDWDARSDAERSDSPAHAVFLSGYYMQETEVTNGQFEAYLENTTTTKPGEWQRVFLELKQSLGGDLARKHPAVCISHKQAQGYADYMDGQLPTEAQWEFAARSRGKPNRYVWGNAPPPSRQQANIDAWEAKTTAIVGSYPADKTAQGLLDMTGNVQEICRDVWERYKKSLLPANDPCPLPVDRDKAQYAIRGAYFSSVPEDCATTRRDDFRPESEAATNLGFRLVVECPDTREPR